VLNATANGFPRRRLLLRIVAAFAFAMHFADASTDREDRVSRTHPSELLTSTNTRLFVHLEFPFTYVRTNGVYTGGSGAPSSGRGVGA